MIKLESLAPEGQVWWCPECGRISADREGRMPMQPGWVQKCAEQALLIQQEDMVFDERGRVVEATISTGQTAEVADRLGKMSPDGLAPEDLLRRIREDATDTLSVVPYGDSRDLVLIHRGHTFGDVFRVTLEEEELSALFGSAQQNFFKWHNEEQSLEVDAVQGSWTLRFRLQASPFAIVHLQLTRGETQELCEALFEESGN